MIVPVSPESDEARELIRELDAGNAALCPGLPINGIDVAEFEKAGGYFGIARDADQAVGCGAFRPVSEKSGRLLIGVYIAFSHDHNHGHDSSATLQHHLCTRSERAPSGH